MSGSKADAFNILSNREKTTSIFKWKGRNVLSKINECGSAFYTSAEERKSSRGIGQNVLCCMILSLMKERIVDFICQTRNPVYKHDFRP